jgi:hypothetical protein
MAQRLIEQIEIMEKVQETEPKRKKKSPVDRLTSVTGSKDKQISAKVNERTYELFTKINKTQGLSNNSVLNQLIYKYVRENKGVLEAENLF